MSQKTEYSLIALIFIAFAAIAAKGIFTAQPGDENVYYFMGKMVSEGYVPYRDFFYAHPPLQLYVIAPIFRMFGFNIAALKLIPLASTLVTAFFIYLISKNTFGKNKAIVSMALFLFSYSTMFNSVFSFGIELAMMFLVMGYYFYAAKNRLFLGGLFFGLAGISRLLSLIPIAVILLLLFLKDREKFFAVSSGFTAIFLSVNLIFLLIAGSGYIFPVYKFHLLKGAEQFKFQEYFNVVKLNWILFLSFLGFIFIKEKKMVMDFAAVSAAYLAAMALLGRVFNFYFMAAFPFLAITGGYCICELLSRIKIKSGRYFIAILAVIIGIFLWNLASDALFLQKTGFEGFSRGKDIKEFISLKTAPAAALFGDSSTAPLAALMTGKKIAFNVIDTNPAVFNTGAMDLGKTLEKLKGNDVIFLVRNIEGISEFAKTREFLSEKCELLSSFSDRLEGLYLVYRCN